LKCGYMAGDRPAFKRITRQNMPKPARRQHKTGVKHNK
jgi:hypothetical protein